MPLVQWGLMTFGVAMVALGLIGIIVPGLPTTVFLIVAVWAFSRSSVRFHQWLTDHPVLGPPLRDWYQHRIIPTKAEIMAVSMMAASLVYMAYVADGELGPVMVLAAVLVPAAYYVCTRASEQKDTLPPASND